MDPAAVQYDAMMSMYSGRGFPPEPLGPGVHRVSLDDPFMTADMRVVASATEMTASPEEGGVPKMGAAIFSVLDVTPQPKQLVVRVKIEWPDGVVPRKLPLSINFIAITSPQNG
ncbi:hypothetical protein ACQP2F_19145 [Actinoplanes sp. CA-030573]|uniref:hypothetical protein n=1 Tax=Actinoplanes sp. CA-030573 TaxID=3239898 RepID=UPI003D8D41BC